MRLGKDCGIEPRRYIALENKAISLEDHEQALKKVDERTACLLKLQRYFGLRFKESALFNAKAALKQVNKNGSIKLDAGTKGGRIRKIPCRPGGIQILEHAVSLQTSYSMIPKDMLFKHFNDTEKKSIKVVDVVNRLTTNSASKFGVRIIPSIIHATHSP